VITAGAKQRSGESRIDLIERNHQILKSVINGMKPINPNAVLLMVANPVGMLNY
jgi:L-lactate dehydrogenase